MTGAVLTPLNDPALLDTYIDAGAEEFYMGFYDRSWSAAFGPYTDLNRLSGFGMEANVCNFEQLLVTCTMVKARGKRFYVTFNTAAYGATTFGMIDSYFEQLAAYGADGVIVSGPELIDNAKARGLQVVASTMCGIFNRDIARFYIGCGIDRIILPRDLGLREIEAIVSATPEVAHEVFLMRNGCVFSDSHCLGMHGMGRGAVCGEMRGATRRIRTSLPMEDVESNSTLHAHTFHHYACGLCALWDFEQMGISAYKIVGRCDESDAITEDIELVCKELEVAARCASREEYLAQMLPHPYADQVCIRGLNCYYPELRF